MEGTKQRVNFVFVWVFFFTLKFGFVGVNQGVKVYLVFFWSTMFGLWPGCQPRTFCGVGSFPECAKLNVVTHPVRLRTSNAPTATAPASTSAETKENTVFFLEQNRPQCFRQQNSLWAWLLASFLSLLSLTEIPQNVLKTKKRHCFPQGEWSSVPRVRNLYVWTSLWQFRAHATVMKVKLLGYSDE